VKTHGQTGPVVNPGPYVEASPADLAHDVLCKESWGSGADQRDRRRRIVKGVAEAPLPI